MSTDSSDVLAIFCKTPQEGSVKTRLGKTIGMQQATTLYRAFLQDLINQHGNQSYKLILFADDSQFPLSQFTEDNIEIVQQVQGDLGVKLRAAFTQLQKQYQKIVVVGSDMPHLTPSHVSKALTYLEKSDLVLGPTEDGGYYLIGMKQCHDVFDHVSWSTDQVFAQTMSHVMLKQLRCSLLSQEFDVDTIDELNKLKEVLDPDLQPATLAALTTIRTSETAETSTPDQ